MKSLLISIQPKWCELIASGKKTIELRKTRPKIDTPFKCYIYETKDKDYDGIGVHWENGRDFLHNVGKVIGEFVCDSIISVGYNKNGYGLDDAAINGVIARSCITEKDLYKYLKGKTPYLWHIADLVIYDKPKELSKFYITDKKAIRQCSNRRQAYYSFTDTGYIKNSFYCEEKDDFCFDGCKRKVLTRPPQSWCYVEELR